MLIATITALLLLGGSGANWTLDYIATSRDQVKSVVEDDIQRRQILDILGEMKSISKSYAKQDKKNSKTVRNMIEQYDTPVEEIGAVILQANLDRHRYQQEMLADRFRMVEATDEFLWKKIFPSQDEINKSFKSAQ